LGKIVLDTEYLRGYAEHLDNLAHEPKEKLRHYMAKHYTNTDGMVDWLSGHRKVAEKFAEIANGNLLSTASGLRQTSYDLTAAADSYDREDRESARQIFTAASHIMPKDYSELDKADESVSAFPNKPNVDLPVPKDVEKAPPYRKQFHKDLDTVSPWVEAITGHDVLHWALSLVHPEWGRLDMIGEAYAHGSAWYSAIADDMQTGMDTLSPHWTDGEASAAFDYFIRKRWMEHLEARSVAERMASEWFVYNSEFIDALIELVAGAVHVFADAAKKIHDAMDDMSAVDYWETAKDLLKAVVALFKFLKTIGKTLGDLSELEDVAIDLAVDEVHAGVNRSYGYHRAPGLSDTT